MKEGDSKKGQVTIKTQKGSKSKWGVGVGFQAKGQQKGFRVKKVGYGGHKIKRRMQGRSFLKDQSGNSGSSNHISQTQKIKGDSSSGGGGANNKEGSRSKIQLSPPLFHLTGQQKGFVISKKTFQNPTPPPLKTKGIKREQTKVFKKFSQVKVQGWAGDLKKRGDSRRFRARE